MRKHVCIHIILISISIIFLSGCDTANQNSIVKIDSQEHILSEIPESSGQPIPESSIKTRTVTMICDSCESTYELNGEEFKQAIKDSFAGRKPMTILRGPLLLPCKKCGEIAAQRAIKCRECGKAVVFGDAGDEKYPDKCPSCGYSRMEQIQQKKLL